MTNEIWAPIKDFDGRYEISNFGNVKSFTNGSGKQRERILKPRMAKNGYLYLNLWRNSRAKTAKIHRLVAEAFVEKNENPHTGTNGSTRYSGVVSKITGVI